FASEVAQTARPIGSGCGHALGVLFKAFFLLIAGSIAFGLLVALIVLVFGGGTALWPVKQSVLDFILQGFWQKTLFWCTVIFFFAVPVIAFITWLVRRLMRVKSQRHYLGYIFGGLWLIGIFCLAGLAGSLIRDFRYSREVTQTVSIVQPANNRMIVTVDEPQIRYNGDLWFIDTDDEGWDLTNDSLKLTNVKIRIYKSLDSNYSVSVIKHSRGRTGNDAVQKALNIQYNVSYSDSILNLGSGYAISRNDKFRAQDVEIEIRVPVGKKINFDQSIIEKLHPVNVHVRERHRWNRRDWDVDIDAERYNFNWRTNVDYVMTETRELVAADELNARPITEQNNTDSINKAIEEKTKAIEQEKQELEKLKQQRQKPTTKVQQSETEEPVAQMPQLFSLII
ncbi:MAG: hypothetical protein ICV66_05565, partial [Chitinophagaceae bacterium]|nr:hypothetical protein [Chitinophagaceae bacterium]